MLGQRNPNPIMGWIVLGWEIQRLRWVRYAHNLYQREPTSIRAVQPCKSIVVINQSIAFFFAETSITSSRAIKGFLSALSTSRSLLRRILLTATMDYLNHSSPNQYRKAYWVTNTSTVYLLVLAKYNLDIVPCANKVWCRGVCWYSMIQPICTNI